MTDKIDTKTNPKMYSYHVDEPQGDSGLFVNFLKYSALFILIWCIAWVFILFRLTSQTNLISWLADNPFWTNVILTLAIGSYFFVRIRKKFKYGEPFEIAIDDTNKLLTIKVKNTFDDSIVVKTIPFDNLVVRIEIKDNKRSRFQEFVETQRIISILNNDKLETLINIQLTAWCRHPEIDNIVEALKSRAKNNWA